jgi:hypothetical protein
MSVHSQLRDLDKEEKKIALKRKRLQAKASKDEGLKSKVEQFATEAGYRNGKALTKALVDIYGVGGSGATGTRRTRTKVTAELRDAIKSEAAGGKAKNRISKERSISYIVVDKIIKGGYDQL